MDSKPNIAPKHPYIPSSLNIPNYIENDKSVVEILAIFFTLVIAVCAVTWNVAGKSRHTSGVLTRAKLCWFACCALIHTILEGYFSFYYESFPGKNDFIAQVWKEYSKGDSRYVSGDSFTVCMEAITAIVDGPLSLLALLAFLYRKPARHVTQLVLSLCQLYGDVLYFSTEIKDGFAHGPMYHPLYFWFYFFFMNILWIIIPSLCIIESCCVLCSSQKVADEKEAAVKEN